MNFSCFLILMLATPLGKEPFESEVSAGTEGVLGLFTLQETDDRSGFLEFPGKLDLFVEQLLDFEFPELQFRAEDLIAFGEVIDSVL